MSFSRRRWMSVALCLPLLASLAAAEDLSRTKPEEVGMSSQRLDRLGGFLDRAVADGRAAGAVAVVARRGKVVYVHASGMADREAQKPMRPDAIFRIASMTKPITSVAVMMLYEEGRLLLDDPLSKYLPEFKNPKVLVLDKSGKSDAKDPKTEPARREITIRHLLNHTSGLTYQWNERLGPLYFKAGITHGLIQDDSTLAEKMKRLAGIPLLHHPGEKFEYGLSIDVLGRVVEVVSGQSLDEFFRRRIFRPLDMNDTFFFVPGEKRDRLAAVYRRTGPGKLERVSDEPIVQGSFVHTVNYPYSGPRSYYSGGGGLCSTAPDYLRFCQMLASGGELNGARIVSRKTIELMTMNQIGELSMGGPQKFGLGFSVLADRARTNLNASAGSYGWGGFFNTTFLIDPGEKLIVVAMTQLDPGHDMAISEVVPVLACQAVAD